MITRAGAAGAVSTRDSGLSVWPAEASMRNTREHIKQSFNDEDQCRIWFSVLFPL